VKRDLRLVGLSREHHHALVLAAHLRKAVQAGGDLAAMARRAARQFADEIDPHFRVEEEILLPALRRLGPAEDCFVQQIEADHAWLRAGAARAAGGETAHLLAWAERLTAHVRFEEREVFEHCQQVLSPEILDAVGLARPAEPPPRGRSDRTSPDDESGAGTAASEE
jgi:hemerythrin-like domain-containing protein